MSDRRNQIPLGCIINIAIIEELSQTKEFESACINTPIKCGVTPQLGESPIWPFFNLSWGAYIMYSLFVVSKELYNLPKEDRYFQNLVSKNAMKCFTIIKEREAFHKDPKYHFTCFRNAISHVKYKIDNNKIIFWDHKRYDAPPEDWHWHIEISNNDFKKFLNLISYESLYFYNEIKSGIRNIDGTPY